MTDPFDGPGGIGGTQEVEVDLAAFLPEGTSVVPGAETDEPGFDDVSAGPGEGLDLAVLIRIESDLADVDAALVAVDAGEPHRSALLRHLLAKDRVAVVEGDHSIGEQDP